MSDHLTNAVKREKGVKSLSGKHCREKMKENPEESKNVKRRMKDKGVEMVTNHTAIFIFSF